MEKKSFKTVVLKTLPSPHLFERKAALHGLLVCGVDEVGRGSLAGPVVAAAAILAPGKKHPLLRDSKLLTPEQRMVAYRWLLQHSWWGIGMAHHRMVEAKGVYQATLFAMERAYDQLQAVHRRSPACILVDAMPLRLPGWHAPQELPEPLLATEVDDPFVYPWHKILHFFHSEERSRSIAAASIIAKVTRDALMVNMGKLFPGYKFEQHKGYGTPEHRTLWQEKGVCIIHRPRFLHPTLAAEEAPLAIPFDVDMPSEHKLSFQ